MIEAPLRSESRARVRAAVLDIRRQIVDGAFASGGQLPTFDALVSTYGVSRATMQVIIRQLKEEGFVRAVHRSGLYVTDRPPHMHRFGLVFSSAPGDADWSRYAAALVAEAPVVLRGRVGVEIVPFFHVRPDGESPATEQLLQDIATHRLAGLLLTEETGFLVTRKEVIENRLPCVALNAMPNLVSDTPVVNTDQIMLYRRALEHLAARGRKRVAVIAMMSRVGVTVEDCESVGLQTRPQWICPVGSEFPGQVRAIMRLLMDYPAQERPDALIIATDQLVSEALSTIHELGVVIGRDIEIVAHCNWPWPVESPLPIARLGFHSHDFLHIALDTLGQIRQGLSPAPQTHVPAVFEHELVTGRSRAMADMLR